MRKRFASLDGFTKSILVVFAGSSAGNVFNLLYQLLVAHKLTPSDFAAFNALLSVCMIFSSPLATLQLAVAKFSAGCNARMQHSKVADIIRDLSQKAFFCALITGALFFSASWYIIRLLKVESHTAGFLAALVTASAWFIPVVSGSLQGLELFGWFSSVSMTGSIVKFSLAWLFLWFGFRISGALGALVLANFISVGLAYIPLRRVMRGSQGKEKVPYREIFLYIVPLAASNFCFIVLVSSDMVLVKYFFSPQDSGVYSLAQMVGKIFLFLPGAVSMVMFPRTSGLKAQQKDTRAVLRQSLAYVTALCVLAVIVYNSIPSFVLRVLTGKAYPEAIVLGRLFGVSMSCFTILFILISYFLSIEDLRFLKYLITGTIVQLAALVFFHSSLMQVQFVLCVNASVLLGVHLALAYTPPAPGDRKHKELPLK